MSLNKLSYVYAQYIASLYRSYLSGTKTYQSQIVLRNVVIFLQKCFPLYTFYHVFVFGRSGGRIDTEHDFAVKTL